MPSVIICSHILSSDSLSSSVELFSPPLLILHVRTIVSSALLFLSDMPTLFYLYLPSRFIVVPPLFLCKAEGLCIQSSCLFNRFYSLSVFTFVIISGRQLVFVCLVCLFVFCLLEEYLHTEKELLVCHNLR